jgi:hypothetical protein
MKLKEKTFTKNVEDNIEDLDKENLFNPLRESDNN